MNLDPKRLSAFMSGHFGYGNFAAPIWFFGMEEGGGNSAEEIERRIAAWSDLGRRTVSDLRDYHLAIGVDRYWLERPPIQRTWGCLIRVLLASKGLAPTTDDVRAYQRDHLGRHDGESGLLELMPLPSPGTTRWLYGSMASDPALATREAYMEHWLPARVQRLRELIAEHRPRAVVFYGVSYLAHWEAVTGVELAEVGDGVRVGQGVGTRFVVAKHPAARLTGNQHFEQVGALARAT